MILAGDVGGTKVDLALYDFSDGKLKYTRDERYAAKEFHGLEEIVKLFLGAEKVTSACFGVPGPVRNGRLRLTNLPWTLDSRELATGLGIQHVFLINDLEANGYGIAELTAEQFYTLSEGDASQIGNRALIAAGTGLGEGFLAWNGRMHVPYPSEGGHVDYAPRNEDEIELLRFLKQRYNGRISFERVVSGMGMTGIYEFLREVKGLEEPVWLAEKITEAHDPNSVITEMGLAAKSELCAKTHVCFGLWGRGGKSSAEGAFCRRALRGRRHRAAHFGEAEGWHVFEGLYRQGPAEPTAHQYAGAGYFGEPCCADGRCGVCGGEGCGDKRSIGAGGFGEGVAVKLG